ncbi:MAG: tripartite tricarboxylate transporter substrate binding protein [Hyphomicrobiales bacterium]|nr:tripartite tricarboxylate transporter substrate binding protein [Hyphomicrobiales bacterium]
MRGLLCLALLTISSLIGTAAQAQAPFPTRPIRVLVTIPPGGAPDIAARLLAHVLQEAHGWSVVVENRPGANGNIASETVAKSPPDGYTLLLHADSGIVINPHVYSKLGFDPIKDLVPVTSIATNQFMLSVNPEVPARTFPEFIELARRTAPPLPYASGGNGSQHQLTMEMLKRRAGIDLLHVPFRGAAPATQSTVAGETKVLFSGSASAPLIQGGQLRAIATSGKQRSKRFPELPTISEFYPGLEVDIWLGLFAPAGTPEPVLAAVREPIQHLMTRPDFAERLNVSGSLEPLVLQPAQFAALIRSDYERYGKIIKELGIRLD